MLIRKLSEDEISNFKNEKEVLISIFAKDTILNIYIDRKIFEEYHLMYCKQDFFGWFPFDWDFSKFPEEVQTLYRINNDLYQTIEAWVEGIELKNV